MVQQPVHPIPIIIFIIIIIIVYQYCTRYVRVFIQSSFTHKNMSKEQQPATEHTHTSYFSLFYYEWLTVLSNQLRREREGEGKNVICIFTIFSFALCLLHAAVFAASQDLWVRSHIFIKYIIIYFFICGGFSVKFLKKEILRFVMYFNLLFLKKKTHAHNSDIFYACVQNKYLMAIRRFYELDCVIFHAFPFSSLVTTKLHLDCACFEKKIILVKIFFTAVSFDMDHFCVVSLDSEQKLLRLSGKHRLHRR